MSSSAIVVNTVTLFNPNGASSDYALYALDQFGGQLYGAGWLNGTYATPSNPDGLGLDRIYVSSSPTLDDFSQVKWTDGQSPGTWNDAYTNTLYDEIANPGTDTWTLQPYYGPGQTLDGSIYYQVNDPTVVQEGSNLVMFMTATPCQNEYPATTVEPNGNPAYQVGWIGIGYAISSDNGATWTWEGALPMLRPDGTPLLAPVTQIFPTDPSVTYPLSAAGDGSPTAIFIDATGLDLWYTNFRDNGSFATDGTPVLWLSHENRDATWDAPRQCQFVNSAGTASLYVIDQDVHVADDGTGTMWMVAQQWGGPNSGDLMLYYSGTADGVNQGVNWHPWDGADGVLVVATGTVLSGLYDFVTPTILSVGNGSLDIDYSVPSNIITTIELATDFNQINQTFILPCFGGGTRLLTCRGEVPVEALRVGERVPTLSDRRLARVRWIGHRHVHLRGHPRPWDVHPVRVRAGAFGEALPVRDLCLSPDHAVFIDGALIPIRFLINGATIVQEPADSFSYWHVELDAHAVLLAEGLAVESYLDTGNRAAFANAGKVVAVDADFAAAQWNDAACATLVTGGKVLVAARKALLARAEKRGYGTTDDPALRVFADGVALTPERDGETLRLLLPAATNTVELRSRTAVPALLRAESEDHRRLGIAVAALACDGEKIPLDHRCLASGWHAPEVAWRWTDGCGSIDVAGVSVLTLRVLPLMHYWEMQDERGVVSSRIS